MDSNIIEADIKTTNDKKGVAHFTIEVEESAQLERIITAIKKIRNVLSVERH